MRIRPLSGPRFILLAAVLALSGCGGDGPTGTGGAGGDDGPPVALARFGNDAPRPYEPFLCDATLSTDDGDYSQIVAWEWDWNNDGVYDATGANVWHFFATPGTHRIGLRVTDDEGDAAVLEAPIVFEVTADDFIVAFPDATLESWVRHAAGVPAGTDLRFSDLEGVTSLCAAGSGISDLTGLNFCHNLTGLDLRWCPLRDLRPLMTMAALDYAYLSGGTFWNLEPLSHCRALTVLILENQSCTNISPLRHCTSLVELTYRDQPGCAGFDQLVSLTSLRKLHIDDLGLTDTATLGQLTNLVDLNVRDNPLGSLAFTASLPHLVHLTADNCGVTDATPVFAHAMETIKLGGNPLNGIAGIGGVTSLVYLSVNDCGLASIASVDGLPHLYHLVADNNQLATIDYLTSLPAIETIYLRNCGLVDICPLCELEGLGDVDPDPDGLFLEGNPLSAGSIDTCIPQLEASNIHVHYD